MKIVMMTTTFRFLVAGLGVLGLAFPAFAQQAQGIPWVHSVLVVLVSVVFAIAIDFFAVRFLLRLQSTLLFRNRVIE